MIKLDVIKTFAGSTTNADAQSVYGRQFYCCNFHILKILGPADGRPNGFAYSDQIRHGNICGVGACFSGSDTHILKERGPASHSHHWTRATKIMWQNSVFQRVSHVPQIRGRRAASVPHILGPPIHAHTQHEKQQPNFTG